MDQDSPFPNCIARASTYFSVVPVAEWIWKLRDYESSVGDMERKQAVKLVDHFERTYGMEKKEEATTGNVTFEIKTAQKHSATLRACPRLVEETHVGRFVQGYLAMWEGEGKGLQVGSSG